MSLEYLVGDKKYSVSYQELKEHYLNFSTMSDEEFMESIKEALHIACIICWFKEIPSYVCLADDGVIHELVHLMHIPEEPLVDLPRIRETFNTTLKLS